MSAISSNSSAKLPTSSLIIEPRFDHDGACGFSCTLSLDALQTKAYATIFTYVISQGNVPSHEYDKSEILASDEQGPLAVQIRMDGNESTLQQWSADRDLVGTLTLKFRVLPRHVDMLTPLGSRIDMRRDQGGILVAGRWFLPRPVKNQEYEHRVCWNLDNAPKGTRAVWSLGEGPETIVKRGRFDMLWDAVYMVGPIRSYPEMHVANVSSAITYWFGDMPENLDHMKAFNSQLHPKMADFFKFHDSNYRVFIRRSIRGFGGTGFWDSYVFEYDASVVEESDTSLTSLFAHEMVHSFAVVSSDTSCTTRWYAEGIAELYSCLLPYRFALRGRSYLVEVMNDYLYGYCTSPLMNMEIHESEKLFFTNWYAELIPYKRGNAFLFQLDSRFRTTSGQYGAHLNSPLDEIVISLATRARQGENIRNKEIVDSFATVLGQERSSLDFKAMMDGKTLDLSQTFLFEPNFKLSSTPGSVLEFGFSKTSINDRLVSEVIPGSTADRAGLKNGDRILSNSRHQLCASSPEAVFQMLVERHGEKINIAYLPHSSIQTIVWKLT